MKCLICRNTKLRRGECCAREISRLRHHVESQSREIERLESEKKRAESRADSLRAEVEGALAKTIEDY